jgi:tetratricopeptide (TPR) repeat protein
MGAIIQPRRQREVGIVVYAIAAALVVSVASLFTYWAYCRLQTERAVNQAKSALQANNIQAAILSLQTALYYWPGNLEVRATIASLLERTRSAEALVHRRTLMNAQPQLVGPKLAYARAALLLDQPEEAAAILKQIRGAHRKSSQFLEVRSELFLTRGRSDLALDGYRELLEVDPKNRRARVKLAALELQAGLEQSHDSARRELESLASDEEFGLIALRALIQDALRREDYPAALSCSERACERPAADFSDRMLRLQALFAAKSPAYDSWLSDLEKSALETPRFALELGKWKVSALGPQVAATWLESARELLKRDPQISVLLAECYSELKRWSDLQSLASSSAWPSLDAVRLAFLARAMEGQGNTRRLKETWTLALKEAARQPAQLDRLLAMGRADKRDVREVLWIIAEKNPRHVSARRELYQAYWEEKNADGMLRMMELVLKENPNDRAARYNVAGLLMTTGRQIERAGRLAKELYESEPHSLGNAALYAFALHLLGQPKKGADILGARKDLQHLSSEGAAYYALVLSACGRGDEARKVLKSVDRQLLLPELRASLDHAFNTMSTNTAVNMVKP